MNIPKDVIEKADQAWRDNMHASPDHVPANAAVSEARQAEYLVIAEWAWEKGFSAGEEDVLDHERTSWAESCTQKNPFKGEH